MKLRDKKNDLDHHVWKILRSHGLEGKRILVALSGGVDSVALLFVLHKIHKKNLLGACYFHHGIDENRLYRDRAQIYCEKLCAQLDVPFFSVMSKASGSSEAELREGRYQYLRRLMAEEKYEIMALGHHRDDLLETRLLRLMRGTGGQGLPAMTEIKDFLFRPLLQVSKKELKDYLRTEKIRAIEDPSNKNLDPLRNWVRNSWLKALEKKMPGGSESLARSLETLVDEVQASPWGELLRQNEAYKSQGLSRAFYLTLSPKEQRRLLAQYLYSLGKKDFSQSHLEEVQKQLDKSKKMISFKVAGCLWEVNAKQIKVES